MHAFQPFTPAETFLEGLGMLNARALESLRNLEVSTRSDLAYIFLTEAEAGEAYLREQWLAARRESLPDVAAMARPCVRLPPPTPPAPRPVRRQFKLRKVRPPAKHAAKNAMQDEAARKHAANLAVSLSMSWAPHAGLASSSPGLDPAQSDMFRVACARRLVKFEAQAIYRHLRVWSRWASWARQRGLAELGAAPAFVEEFIDTFSDAPTAARARWDSFAWLRKYLSSPFDVAKTTKPTRLEVGGEVQEEAQAPVCEPEVLIFLELTARRMRAAGDWRFGPVLGAIVEALSGLRFSHLQRSSLLAYSPVAFTAQCYKGKAAVMGARPAFRWHCPAKGLDDTPVAEWLFEAWTAWRTSEPERTGLVRDFLTGRALSISQYNAVIREVVEPLVLSGPDDVSISSYSFRRVLPTLADIRQLPLPKRYALGGWKGIPKAPDGTKTNLIPFRYADRKDLTEQVAKITAARVISAAYRVAARPCTWECVRAVLSQINPDSIEERVEREVAAAVPIVFAPGVKPKQLGQQARRLRLRGACVPMAPPRPPLGEAPADSRQPAQQPGTSLSSPAADLPGAARTWLIARNGAGYTHFFQYEGDSSALCNKWRAGKGHVPKQAHRGIGLKAAVMKSRSICPSCASRLPPAEQAQLALAPLS